MNNNFKCYPAAIVIFSLIFFCCSFKDKDPRGSWESVLIENKSPLFAKTLPSAARGEVLLYLGKDDKFTWINKSEKLNLTGKYRIADNRIFFDPEGDEKPLDVEFRLAKGKLIIITDDGFSFTFIKAE